MSATSSKPALRRLLRFGAALTFSFLAGVPGAWGASENDVDDERLLKLKSAFIYNFCKFVEWPEDAFENADDDILVGVLDPAERLLVAKILDGRRVGDRHLRVVSVERPEGGYRRCHLVFMGGDVDEDTLRLLGHLKKRPVLSVGDGRHFNEHGGLVQFVVSDSKLRFQVHLGAVRESGLQISSQLLRLALVYPETSEALREGHSQAWIERDLVCALFGRPR